MFLLREAKRPLVNILDDWLTACGILDEEEIALDAHHLGPAPALIVALAAFQCTRDFSQAGLDVPGTTERLGKLGPKRAVAQGEPGKRKILEGAL